MQQRCVHIKVGGKGGRMQRWAHGKVGSKGESMERWATTVGACKGGCMGRWAHAKVDAWKGGRQKWAYAKVSMCKQYTGIATLWGTSMGENTLLVCILVTCCNQLMPVVPDGLPASGSVSL